MSPEYVRPYVKAHKNDDRDAEAIAEAAARPTMRFVEIKSEAQLDLQSLHRARERLVSERTALINHLRALLLERGIVVPRGRRKLKQALPGMLDAAADPDHPNHAEAKEWLDDYDPDAIIELPIKYALGRIANQRNAAKARIAKTKPTSTR